MQASIEPYIETLRSGFDAAIQHLTSFVHQHSFVADKKSTADSPPTAAAAAVGLLTLAAFLMAGWSRRLWGGGRFSPFAAAEYPPQVSNEDYSYITADDLAGAPQSYDSHVATPQQSPRAPASDDVLLLNISGHAYARNFPPFSIDDNLLKIGDVREEAAKVARMKYPSRVKLLYKGRNLSQDARSCREEGLKHESEILCVVSEEADVGESEEGSTSGGDSPNLPGNSTRSDKKRHRGRKKKGKKTRTDSSNAGASGLAPPNVGGLDGASRGNSRGPSPPPPQAPKTPLSKLDEISSNFSTKLLPECVQFTNNPPADHAKKDFEHRRLSETVLSQVLLKLDAVETEGDAEARQRRKDLVKQVQGVLNGLDAIMKEQKS